MARLAQLAVNDEGFVFDPTTGDSYQVSGTGLLILTALRAGQADEAIALALTEKFEVSLHDAQHDVADFCGTLKNLCLL